MNQWWLILGMMAVTFGVRYPVLALMSRRRMPEPLFRALEFVPVAVLSAIVVPILLSPNGELQLSAGNAHLLAGAVAILTSMLSRNLLLTISIGMAAFLVLRHGLL